MGTRKPNSARLGMAYSPPARAANGAYARRHRRATTAMAMAITNPMPTDVPVSCRCSMVRSRMSSVCRPTQSHHRNESGPLATSRGDVIAGSAC